MFANPHGLHLGMGTYSTEEAFLTLASMHTGVLSLAETNINWDHPSAKSKLHNITRKVWKHSSVAFSHTSEKFKDLNQPGGTLMMACGDWTSRVIEKGVDPYGLGGWSHLVLRGKNNIKILIVSVY